MNDVAEPIGSTSSSVPERLHDQTDEEEKQKVICHAKRRDQLDQKAISINEDRMFI